MIAGPIAGSSAAIAISMPHSSAAGSPTIQKVIAPSAPCASATTPDPLIVARTTVTNLSASCSATCGSSGSARTTAGPIRSPSRNRKKVTYSPTPNASRNAAALAPIDSARRASWLALLPTACEIRACARSKLLKPERSRMCCRRSGSASCTCWKYCAKLIWPVLIC